MSPARRALVDLWRSAPDSQRFRKEWALLEAEIDKPEPPVPPAVVITIEIKDIR